MLGLCSEPSNTWLAVFRPCLRQTVQKRRAPREAPPGGGWGLRVLLGSTAWLFGNSPTNPTCGETQFRRWIGGKLLTLPGPATCQILESMWPEYTAVELNSFRVATDRATMSPSATDEAPVPLREAFDVSTHWHRSQDPDRGR